MGNADPLAAPAVGLRWIPSTHPDADVFPVRQSRPQERQS